MYRLCGTWIITVVSFRNFQGIWVTAFGPEWGEVLNVPGSFLGWVVALEVYLQKSGRFDWGMVGKAVGAKEITEQCPFLGVTEEEAGEKCLLHTAGKSSA